MKTIVGIRPTGRLHIGHYFSVIKPALEEGADVLVARHHAPFGDWELLAEELEGFGLKPIIQDVDVGLFFQLLEVAPLGELKRMTQYKSAKIKTPHLLVYPVLMACDVAGYDRVIVGEDQRQHLEFARRLLRKTSLKVPKGDYRGGRIMDLRKPDQKMSKSNPSGCLFLDDSQEEIRRKLRKAVTTPAGLKNLRNLYKMLGGKEKFKSNLELKETLAELIIEREGEE